MDQRAVAIQSYFRDRLTGTHYLRARGEGMRRAAAKHGGRRGDCFRIGSSKRADAPASEALIGGSEHALVTIDDRGAALYLLPPMTGQLRAPGGAQTLASLLTDGGPRIVALDEGNSAEVHCGSMTFRIAPTTAPVMADVTPVRWRGPTRPYALGVVLATALAAGIVAFIPADQKALSLDFDGANIRYDKILITAPETLVPPPSPGPVTATANRGTTSGPKGASSSDPGRAGKSDARRTSPQQRLALRETSQRYDLRQGPAPITLVSLIGHAQSSMVRSIFSRGQALGPDADNVLGQLAGESSQPPWGLGGLGSLGTGAHDAGDGQSLIGVAGPLVTMGDRGPNGRGPRPGAGDLGSDGPHVGAVIPAINPGSLLSRGGLDKEIVRRIIRAHVNEIRYCYERELSVHPRLSGRVVLQFAIAPNGQVATSAVQESTLHLGSLEGCMTQAVRRWMFPQPAGGGGLTVVSYPFVLSPSGG